MAQSDPPSPGPITLDQLIALNDEIAALVRAGVPLEPALAELGTDLPGRLGKLAKVLAERARRGQSLGEVLGDASVRLPGVYRKVVETGVRAGRLSAALEALAGTIRRVAETRRGVVAAALYPLSVAMLAWGLLALFAHFLVPRLAGAMATFDVAGRGLFRWLARCGQSAVWWGPAIPILLLIVAAVWWHSSSRAAAAEPRLAGWLLGWLPWVGRSLRWSRTATFAEVLALLVESGVPLDEAVVSAAETSGDRRMVPAARRWADALRRGGELDSRRGDRRELPPLVLWLLGTADTHAVLLSGLRHAAEGYHRRARHQAELARVLLPVLLTGVLGGSIAMLYALTLFAPYVTMLKSLAEVWH